MKKVILIAGSVIIGLVSLLAILLASVGGAAGSGDQIFGQSDSDLVVFASSDCTATYNGQELTCKEWSLASGTLLEGHTAKVTVTGAITDVGSCENTLTASIVDASGADVSHLYRIECRPGTLTVVKRPVKLVANSLEKVYDGVQLVGNGYKMLDGSLAEGHGITASYIGQIIGVGSTECKMTATITDAEGKDVTSNYDVTCYSGKLTVLKRHLTVRSATVERVYNGVPLTNDTVSIVGGSIADEQRMTSYVSGRITGTGETSNSFTVSITDKNGEDVSENYDINYIYGTLKVSPSRLTVYTGSGVKTYDGKEFSCEDWGIVSGMVATGERLNAEFTSHLSSVGVSANSAVFTVTNSAGEDTTKNYSITVITGTIEVLERGLVVASASDVKTYDGSPLQKQEITILDNGLLAQGHYVHAVYTGSQTAVGESENEFVAFVYDEAGNDVTSNYDLLLQFGTLTVVPSPLSVSSPDEIKMYDGSALQGSKDSLIYTGSLGEGHRYDIKMTGSITDAGTGENSFELRVLDENGMDVTESYNISTVFGDLTVTKRPYVVVTPDESFVYDGEQKSSDADDCTVEGSLGEGDSCNIVMTAIRTDAGSMDNTAQILFTRNDRDVSENYDVTIVPGKITVVPRPIAISTDSAEKTYDGLPLVPETNPGWSLISELAPVLDHSIDNVVFISYITNVGMVDNEIYFDILTAEGESVKHNYDVTVHTGTLRVIMLEVTFRSGSAEKIYDGTPLTCGDWELIYPASLPVGHTAVVSVSGERTLVGESENTFTVNDIVNANGKSVINNFDCKYEYGALVVKPTSGENPGDEGGDGGDGGDLDSSGNIGGGGGQPQNPVPIMDVKSTVTGPLYMRLESFGDYTGRGWEKATEYSGTMYDSYSYNYLAGAMLGMSGASKQTLEVANIKTKDYLLPYYLSPEGSDYVIQQSDVKFSGTHNGAYSLYYYSYNGTGSDINVVSPFVSQAEMLAAEQAYASFVRSQYLKIDDETLEYMEGIIDAKGFDKNDPDIISKVAYYIQNEASYSLDYPENLDSEANMVIAFLDEYKVGLCRHYASAATMLFRALGIPARYTIGYMGSTLADEWVTIKSDRGHAWTEVYLDGKGWIMVEVTGGDGNEDDEDDDDNDNDNKPKIVVTPVYSQKQFDGEALTHSNSVKLKGFEEYAAMGYTYEATVYRAGGDPTVTASLRQAGTITTTAENAVKIMYNGEDVTDQFNIEYHTSSMLVYYHVITVTSEGATKQYDGTPITCDKYTVSHSANDSSLRVEVEFMGSQTNVGTSSNTFRVRVYDSKNVDVTSQYRIDRKPGALSVTRKPLVIVSKDAEMVYDFGQTTLTCNEWSFGDGTSCVEGHTVEVKITGEQTEVGDSENTIESVVVKDAGGKDVTSNYLITTKQGVLFVAPPQ